MTTSSLLRRSVLAVIALLVLAMLIVPYVIGMNTETEFRNAEQAIAAGSPYAVSVKPVYFHRGWFSSDARTEYTIMTGGQPSYLFINHHINQFFVPFYRWVEVRHEITHLDLASQPVPIPADLNLYTDKLFFGGIATHLVAPTISIQSSDGAQFTVKNLNFQVRVNGAGSRQVDLDVPTASINPGNRMPSFILTNLSLHDKSSGTQTADALWQQNGQAHLDKVELSNGPATLFFLQNINMQTELKDNGQNIDVVYHSDVEKSQFGPTDQLGAKDIHLDFSYLNLNKAALLSLQATMRDINAQSATVDPIPADLEAQQARFKQSLQALIQKSGPLIANSPAFKIDRLSVKTQFGDVSGNGEVHVNGDNFDPLAVTVENLTEVVKSRLTGSGSLKVARDIILHKSGSGQAAEMQHKMIENMLNVYVGQGYVVDDGKTLTVNGSFGPNGVDVNGKHLM